MILKHLVDLKISELENRNKSKPKEFSDALGYQGFYFNENRTKLIFNPGKLMIYAEIEFYEDYCILTSDYYNDYGEFTNNDDTILKISYTTEGVDKVLKRVKECIVKCKMVLVIKNNK